MTTTPPRGALALCLLLLAAPLEAETADATDAAEAMPGADAGDLLRPAAPREDSDAMPGEAVLALGREVFTQVAEPQCAVCHALDDAGAAGEIGPDLDDLAPTARQVHAAVTGGVGVMPAYDGVLSDEQIDAVSIYVATVSGAEEATLGED